MSGYSDLQHTSSIDSLRIGNVKATAICDSLGRVIVTNVTGGTQPYMYSLDDSGTGQSNSHLPVKAGNHTATVTDAKGCEVKRTLLPWRTDAMVRKSEQTMAKPIAIQAMCWLS